MLPITANFVTIATASHVAPPARMIFAEIEKKPTAGLACALGQTVELARRKKLAGIAHNRP